MCSRSRRENYGDPSTQLRMTMIPAYDKVLFTFNLETNDLKVYQQYQNYIDDYEELKHNFEKARGNLVQTMEVEAVTPGACLNAIAVLIQREQQTNDSKLLKVQDKFPYILLDTRASNELMTNLSPVLKFLNVLEHARNEMVRFEALFEKGKRQTRGISTSGSHDSAAIRIHH